MGRGHHGLHIHGLDYAPLPVTDTKNQVGKPRIAFLGGDEGALYPGFWTRAWLLLKSA